MHSKPGRNQSCRTLQRRRLRQANGDLSGQMHTVKGVGAAGLLVAITICSFCSCNAQTLPHHNDNYNNNNNNTNTNSSSPDASVCAKAIAVYGYQCQEYLVTTSDGYILSVQRIPHGRLGRRRRDPPSPTKNRPPVLFQHGLLLDGRSWFYNKAEANLPMILADKGYDVWISNTRGTEYSRRHQYLDPNAREFWYWTWDHLAKYDLPVLIDLVFKTTGQKVHFVGHALGSLLCLAALAEGNVGVDKVRSAALLSPTVYAST
ncbi:hypothetical protein DM860_005207 [Cuscuta australis]|uniref:Partial AB-hydrolase lipase domain-containing protein n=1 Tax=Cuscuta australis TaxID=267555 RepID=A0A328DQH9_9ASTE|nr:hypothetical protein DM860_005207 [Cuscuta australis]